jgi:hypothetical protein
MNLRTFSCFAAAIAGTLTISGCSERGPKTVPVYGTVTFAGGDEPSWCHIYFTPTKSEGTNRPTFADRQSNGGYTAKSFSSSRGLLPGTYRVRVNWYQLKPGKDPNKESNWDEISFDAGELVVGPNSSGIKHDIDVPKKS